MYYNNGFNQQNMGYNPQGNNYGSRVNEFGQPLSQDIRVINMRQYFKNATKKPTRDDVVNYVKQMIYNNYKIMPQMIKTNWLNNDGEEPKQILPHPCFKTGEVEKLPLCYIPITYYTRNEFTSFTAEDLVMYSSWSEAAIIQNCLVAHTYMVYFFICPRCGQLYIYRFKPTVDENNGGNDNVYSGQY